MQTKCRLFLKLLVKISPLKFPATADPHSNETYRGLFFIELNYIPAVAASCSETASMSLFSVSLSLHGKKQSKETASKPAPTHYPALQGSMTLSGSHYHVYPSQILKLTFPVQLFYTDLGYIYTLLCEVTGGKLVVQFVLHQTQP